MARAWGFTPKDQHRVARCTLALATAVSEKVDGGQLDIRLLMGRQIGVEVVAHELETVLLGDAVEGDEVSPPTTIPPAQVRRHLTETYPSLAGSFDEIEMRRQGDQNLVVVRIWSAH